MAFGRRSFSSIPSLDKRRDAVRRYRRITIRQPGLAKHARACSQIQSGYSVPLRRPRRPSKERQAEAELGLILSRTHGGMRLCLASRVRARSSGG